MSAPSATAPAPAPAASGQAAPVDDVRVAARMAQRRASRRVGIAVTAGPAVLALALIANGVRVSSRRDRSGQAVAAQHDLKRALGKVPFTVRLPERSRTDTKVVRVVLEEPSSKNGPDIYTLGVYYNAVGPTEQRPRDTVWSYVYQTNDTFITARLKDPLNNPGERLEIAGAPWFRVRGVGSTNRSASSFTRRFDDGITMVVEARTDDVARAQIEALAPQSR